jgi:integrase
VLVLGDGGLRCEELAGLQRVDFVAARKGAKLRALEGRHGKGDRWRTVKLSERASRAIVRWGHERAAVLGAPARDAALFITLGRRKADGSYAGVGRRCGQPALAAVIKRLGTLANIPAELCHPHALRHTCATELLRTGANIAASARSSGMRRSRRRRFTSRPTSSAKRTSSRAASVARWSSTRTVTKRDDQRSLRALPRRRVGRRRA